MVKGTCCTCQGNVECVPYHGEGSDEDLTTPVRGKVAVNPASVVTVEHEFAMPGVGRCDGSGLCPQAAWVD